MRQLAKIMTLRQKRTRRSGRRRSHAGDPGSGKPTDCGVAFRHLGVLQVEPGAGDDREEDREEEPPDEHQEPSDITHVAFVAASAAARVRTPIPPTIPSAARPTSAAGPDRESVALQV